jgi:hypothetical protein
MDRTNWTSYNIDYYSQAPQEDGQHTSQPETGQTSAGVAESGPWGSGPWGSHPSESYPAPGQPYPNPYSPVQIPASPRSDWEYMLRSPRPTTVADIIPSQTHLEDGQHTFQPDIGQTSAGIAMSGPWDSYLAPGLLYPNPQMPSSPCSDWEYLLRSPQSTTVEDISQNDALLESFSPQATSPQATVPARRRKPRVKGLPPVKERFLAGLEAFAQGALLKDCSATLPFYDYIHSDGSLAKRGTLLYPTLTSEEKALLDQAIIARQRARCNRSADDESVAEHFLEDLENYAQGAPLNECSATLNFGRYVTNNGRLHKEGEELYARLLPEARARVDQALRSRRERYNARSAANGTTVERFLAGLENYAQGVPLKDCSATLPFKNYVTDKGRLHPLGGTLRKSLSPQDQMRLSQALLRRHELHAKGVMDKDPYEERFLAAIDVYARGVPINKCSTDVYLNKYVTDDGYLQPGRGESLYNKLSRDDKARVDQALTDRGKIITQRTSADVDKFLATLGPYSNGLTLEQCKKQPGLKRKVTTYLTPEGGLTSRGRRLVENLQPDQQADVKLAIEKRRQFTDPSAQVTEPPWPLPEMPLSMQEPGGMNQAAMTDPMQTEAMWATTWQLTGQAMPGTWGLPVESAEPSIPYYGSDVVGVNFQHRYDSDGLMPQSAPDRLIGRGIEDRMLINILGEEYRVHYMGSSGNPTNENPYGNKFMLVPRMRGG